MANVRFRKLSSNMRITAGSWVFNFPPTTNKWRKIMSIFKKRKKRIAMYSINSITEQEYVDQKFERIEHNIGFLAERIEILEKLNERDYIFIQVRRDTYIKEQWRQPKEARKWAKEDGYEYIQTFKNAGELWAKEKKGKK